MPATRRLSRRSGRAAARVDAVTAAAHQVLWQVWIVVSFLMDGVHPHDIGTIVDRHGIITLVNQPFADAVGRTLSAVPLSVEAA